MDIERYTDRVKGFIQAAQSLALREGHQQFTPEHVLKVLLDDDEGSCGRPHQSRAGGRRKDALAAVEKALAKRPKVTGSGGGQLYIAPELARIFDNAEKIADKAGDQLRHGRAPAFGARAGEGFGSRPHSGGSRRHAGEAQRGHQRNPQGSDRGFARRPSSPTRRLKRYTRDLTGGRGRRASSIR